jgi:RNA polymerase sigma factor (TIGR02999 family)
MPDAAPPPDDAPGEGPDIGALLERMSGGDVAARDEVFRRLYGDLRHLAAWLLDGRDDGTLRPTDLLHGAYLKLVREPRPWSTRVHFVRVAAEAMRHVLVDYRRGEAMRKRGGDAHRAGGDALETVVGAIESHGPLLLDLNAAIETLRGEDAIAAEMAILVVFGGLKKREAARVLGLRQRTGERTWFFANARLRRLLAAWHEPDGEADRGARAG